MNYIVRSSLLGLFLICVTYGQVIYRNSTVTRASERSIDLDQGTPGPPDLPFFGAAINNTNVAGEVDKDFKLKIGADLITLNLNISTLVDTAKHDTTRTYLPFIILSRVSDNIDKQNASAITDLLGNEGSTFVLRFVPMGTYRVDIEHELHYGGSFDYRGYLVRDSVTNDVKYSNAFNISMGFQYTGPGERIESSGKMTPGKYSFSLLFSGSYSDKSTLQKMFVHHVDAVGAIQAGFSFKVLNIADAQLNCSLQGTLFLNKTIANNDGVAKVSFGLF